MGLKIFLEACLLIVLALVTTGQETKFDVREFGAKADGMADDTRAFMRAWKMACNHTKIPSTILISEGKYNVSFLEFRGPCLPPSINIQIYGTIQAPIEFKNQKRKKNKDQRGWVEFTNINWLTISGGGVFDGQGSLAWSQNDCSSTRHHCTNSLSANLKLTGLNNSMIRDIRSVNSKLFHIHILNCNNMTLQNITINAPERSKNTDGIHIGRSSEINVTDADIRTGDDCVSIGDGSRRITIENVTCGPGHGISVGSLGKYVDEQPVDGVNVRNCTITNTTNGVRIKTFANSHEGVASSLHFEDIIMNNVSNPVIIDQEYCPHGLCKSKQVPSRIRISNVQYKNIRGSSASQIAVKLFCSRDIPCNNVEMNDINLIYNNGKNGSTKSKCENVNPIVSGKLIPPACEYIYN